MNLAKYPPVAENLGRPLIFDSNLLLLKCCIDIDAGLIQGFKRLNKFLSSDVELMRDVLLLFPSIQTTPHGLTEVSNLSNQLPSWMRPAWLRQFAAQIECISEDWSPSVEIAKDESFWLGLTDAALCRLATNHPILTIDFPLSNYLESRGLRVINFTHLRSLQLA